jgi:hypothetical protein
MSHDPYNQHEALVATARERPELWRLILGLLIAGAAILMLNLTLRQVLMTVAPGFWASDFARPDAQGTTPGAMLILLGSFGFVILGVVLAARLMQERTGQSILGDTGEAIRQLWAVIRALVILGVVMIALPPYGAQGEPFEPNLAPGLWLMLLPLSLLAIAIQSGAEEFLFRGYMQQQLAARFRSPLIWLGVPSALFGLAHYMPAQAGENAILIAVWSGLFGLLMADLTARSGTLGPAIALHFANNATALLIVSLPDTMSGLSLFTAPFSMADAEALRAWMPVEFASMFVTWLVARLALRR